MAGENLRPETFVNFQYSILGDVLTIRLQSRITLEELNEGPITIQFETDFLGDPLRLQITITHNRQTNQIEAYLQVRESPRRSLPFTIRYWIWPLQNVQQSRPQEFTYLYGVEERSAINPFCRAPLIVQYLAPNNKAKGQRRTRFIAFCSEIVVRAEHNTKTALEDYLPVMFVPSKERGSDSNKCDRSDSEKCDHVILIGDQAIGAHRRHLVHSGFFRREFHRIPAVNLTIITTISLEVLYDLLRFMYALVIHPTRLQSEDLLEAAREFEMGILINICESARNMQPQGVATGSSSIKKVEKATTAAKKVIAKITNSQEWSDTLKICTDFFEPIVQNPIGYIRDRVVIPDFLSGLHGNDQTGDSTTNPQPSSSADADDFDGDDLRPMQRKRSSPVQRRRPSIVSRSSSASSGVRSLDGSHIRKEADASNAPRKIIASSTSGSSNQLSMSRFHPGNRERMATESTLSTESPKETRSYASESVMCATAEISTDESYARRQMQAGQVMNQNFVFGMIRDAEGNVPNHLQIDYDYSMANSGSQSLDDIASITEETSIDDPSSRGGQGPDCQRDRMRSGSLSDISSIAEDNGNLSTQSSRSSQTRTTPSLAYDFWDGKRNQLDFVKESIKSLEELPPEEIHADAQPQNFVKSTPSSANDFWIGERERSIYIREPTCPAEILTDELLPELEEMDALIAEELQLQNYLEQFNQSESYSPSPSNSACDLFSEDQEQLSFIREVSAAKEMSSVEVLSEEEQQKMDAHIAEDLEFQNYMGWFKPLVSYDFWHGERNLLGYIRGPNLSQQLSELDQQRMDARIVEELKFVNDTQSFHLPRPSCSRNIQPELPLGGGVKRKDPNRSTKPNESALDSESDDAWMPRNVQPIVTQRNGSVPSVPIDDSDMPALLSLSAIESGQPTSSSSPTTSHSESGDAETSHNGHHIATHSNGSKPADDHLIEVLPSDNVAQASTGLPSKELVGTAPTRQSTKSTTPSSSSIALHAPPDNAPMSHNGHRIATHSNGSRPVDEPMEISLSDTAGRSSTGLSSIESVGTADSPRQSTESTTSSSSSTKPKETKDNTKGSDDSEK
ncbi:uncharacterized protein LOC119081934 isoform X2 [Bradysia coprophila]|uniref:uncharacterized protein LOC119081934 isoform X2 n=1 Tax=Bradysia coprophila TaxID=38358 RepID=UPI00187DD4BB|nr:uncharacterized protein LOC119081934 isoform X2 [Bradysia coprophila]